MTILNRIPQIIQGKCPNCEVGDIFSKKGNIFLLRMPQMNENCPHCGHRFEREPGYFLGAMFVSYALTIAESVAIYIVLYLFNASIFTVLCFLLSTMILLSLLNFKYARIIWMYFFTDKRIV